jgi:hypothetical protein
VDHDDDVYSESEFPFDESKPENLLDDTGFEAPSQEGGPLKMQGGLEEVPEGLEGLDEPPTSGDLAEQHFHKALSGAAEFLRKLRLSNNNAISQSADDMHLNYPSSPSKYRPGDPLQQYGHKDYDDEDDEDSDPSPFKERSKKPGFDLESQGEARRHASAMDDFLPHIKDADALSKVSEAIELLRSLVGSRQSRGGTTDPLEPHELQAIDSGEKALRSLLSGKRRGKFPTSEINRHGKGISIDAASRDIAQTTKDIKALTNTLNDLMERL